MHSTISIERGAYRARKGDLMDVDLSLYAIIDPSVAGGRTLDELARLHRRQRHAGATARQARLHPRHDRGSARADGGAGAARYSAADQRPRRRRARGRSRRRAYRAGRHVAGRCAAAARPHGDHRAEHQDRWRRRRPRRSNISTTSRSAASTAPPPRKPPMRRSASRACAPSCRRCARARAIFRSAPSPASMKATRPK